MAENENLAATVVALDAEVAAYPEPTLEELRDAANGHHWRVVESLRTCILAAKAAGQALEEAHKLVPHGEWQTWLRLNFRGSYETSCRYRQIARPKNWEVIRRHIETVETYGKGWDAEKGRYVGGQT